MPNYNVKITNPKGEHHLHFLENVSMDEAKEFLTETGPAPIGWFYQLVNLHKKERAPLHHILITGYYYDPETGETEKVGERRTRGDTGETPKQAKKYLRSLGASFFTREKIYRRDGVRVVST